MASELSSASSQVSRSLRQKTTLRTLNDDDEESRPCTVSHATKSY